MKPAAAYCKFERSTAAPVILPDEQLEHWAEVYLALPALAARGVTFEQFLLATPQVRNVPRLLVQIELRARIDKLAAEIARGMAVEAGGLGPRQREEIAALERAGARCENGRWVEPLRHHAYPRSRRNFAPERSGQ